jgi:hypothetical protein
MRLGCKTRHRSWLRAAWGWAASSQARRKERTRTGLPSNTRKIARESAIPGQLRHARAGRACTRTGHCARACKHAGRHADAQRALPAEQRGAGAHRCRTGRTGRRWRTGCVLRADGVRAGGGNLAGSGMSRPRKSRKAVESHCGTALYGNIARRPHARAGAANPKGLAAASPSCPVTGQYFVLCSRGQRPQLEKSHCRFFFFTQLLK